MVPVGIMLDPVEKIRRKDMMRKILIVLTTSTAMAFAQVSPGALAAPRSMGSGGGMHSGSFHGGSISGAPDISHGRVTTRAINSPRIAGSTRFSSNNWRGDWRHRHHRFHRRFVFGVPFAFGAYAADDSCYSVRRVWTHWGWRWRRVYICDYPDY